MTHQAPPAPTPSGSDPGKQVAQLREALILVRTISGSAPVLGDRERLMDEAARVSAAYDAALPLARRRFDGLAGETAAWVSAGVENLLAVPEEASLAAAERVAAFLERALADLHGLVIAD